MIAAKRGATHPIPRRPIRPMPSCSPAPRSICRPNPPRLSHRAIRCRWRCRRRRSLDPAAAQLDTIVAAALEGPQVELDALLGPATPAEPVLARIMLGDGGAVGVLGDGASGQSFIADLAQQHVVVQLEQMASAGHA